MHFNQSGLPVPFIVIFSIVILVFSSCNDEPMITDTDEIEFAVDIGESEIPYIVISTNNADIQNEPKIPATMKIYENNTLIQDLTIGIEYRGSTSFRLSDKKSYGIETWDENGADADTSIFGFPEEEDWILNGHVVNVSDQYIFDRTLIYQYFAYKLSNQIGKYASRTKLVEVEINEVYLGVYVFMEKLKRDKNRIDINRLNEDENGGEGLTGGYILKIDKTAGGDLNLDQPLEYFLTNWDDDARYTEDIAFRSAYDINGQEINFAPYGPPYHDQMYLETYFLYEYPKYDEITSTQKTYIQDYIQQFEAALLTDDFTSDTRTYTDYIDVSSFVDYFLLNEVCRNIDAYRLSTYLQKDKGGKLQMGPIWDMNIGFDSGDRIPWNDWVIHYNNYVSQDAWMMPFWWPRLLEDPQFRQAVKSRWQELRQSEMATFSLYAIVDDAVSYLQNNGAINRNYEKWDIGTPVDYDQSINALKSFLEQRTAWMDGEIGGW